MHKTYIKHVHTQLKHYIKTNELCFWNDWIIAWKELKNKNDQLTTYNENKDTVLFEIIFWVLFDNFVFFPTKTKKTNKKTKNNNNSQTDNKNLGRQVTTKGNRLRQPTTATTTTTTTTSVKYVLNFSLFGFLTQQNEIFFFVCLL